jgi:hypothetical protein
MKTKKHFGFENFTKPGGEGEETTPHTPPQTAPPRRKAKGATVALTIRLSKEQWHRVHELARNEGISFQDLALQGLSKIFQEKGLKDL